MAYLTFSVRDFSDEYGRVQFPITDAAPADTGAEIAGWVTDMAAAIAGVSLGNVARQSVVLYEGGTDERPASALAQREFGLRVFYQTDTSFEKRNLTIPAVDIAALTIAGGSDLADITAGALATLVAEMESQMEVGGETITVTHAQIVGRNS